jgi:hypothetical protein
MSPCTNSVSPVEALSIVQLDAMRLRSAPGSLAKLDAARSMPTIPSVSRWSSGLSTSRIASRHVMLTESLRARCPRPCCRWLWQQAIRKSNRLRAKGRSIGPRGGRQPRSGKGPDEGQHLFRAARAIPATLDRTTGLML